MPFFKGDKKLPSPLPIPIEKSVFRAPKHTPASAAAPAPHAKPALLAADEPVTAAAASMTAADLPPPPPQQQQQQQKLQQPQPSRAAPQSQRRPMLFSGDAEPELSQLNSFSISGGGGSSSIGGGGIGSGISAFSSSVSGSAARAAVERSSPPPATGAQPADAKPKFGRRAAQ
jgi:hypothetical protein